MTSKKLPEVLMLVKSGVKQTDIANKFGISQAAISLMLHRAGYCPRCGKEKNHEAFLDLSEILSSIDILREEVVNSMEKYK